MRGRRRGEASLFIRLAMPPATKVSQYVQRRIAASFAKILRQSTSWLAATATLLRPPLYGGKLVGIVFLSPIPPLHSRTLAPGERPIYGLLKKLR